jgi:hypothetical protein
LPETKSEALEKITSDAVARGIYDNLLAHLTLLGPYEVEAKKTSLHITRGRAFLGVHPRRGGLLLNIVTPEALEDPRIKKAERVSANRWHNEVVVSSPGDLDAELLGWLRQAYELTS